MRCRSIGKPVVVIAAAPIGERSTIVRAASSRFRSPHEGFQHSAEIVTKGRRLGGLPMRIGDDDVGPLPPRRPSA